MFVFFRAAISAGVTQTRTKKCDGPVISDGAVFGAHLIETGRGEAWKQEVNDRENEKCHLDFSVNEQRNGHSVDLQWFIRLDPSAAVSSARTVSYSSGTLVCNLVDLLLMNLSISLCLGCFSGDGGVGGPESAKSRLLRFHIQSVWKPISWFSVCVDLSFQSTLINHNRTTGMIELIFVSSGSEAPVIFGDLHWRKHYFLKN